MDQSYPPMIEGAINSYAFVLGSSATNITLWLQEPNSSQESIIMLGGTPSGLDSLFFNQIGYCNPGSGGGSLFSNTKYFKVGKKTFWPDVSASVNTAIPFTILPFEVFQHFEEMLKTAKKGFICAEDNNGFIQCKLAG